MSIALGYLGAADTSRCDKYKKQAQDYRKLMWKAGVLTKTRAAYEKKANAAQKMYSACKLNIKSGELLKTAKPTKATQESIAKAKQSMGMKTTTPGGFKPSTLSKLPSSAVQAAVLDPAMITPTDPASPANVQATLDPSLAAEPAAASAPLGIPVWGWALGAVALLGGGALFFRSGKREPAYAPAYAAPRSPVAAASPLLAPMTPTPSPAPVRANRRR